MRHRIVVLDSDTLGPGITLRRPAAPHDWEVYPATAPDQVEERLRGATVAVVNKVRLDEALLGRLPDLRLVAIAATGTDNVDLEACRRLGITVTHIRGYAVHTVPEHTFALILALRRNIVAYRRDVADGVWQRSGQFCLFTHPIHDLHGSRLGIIGEGAIGGAVADLGKAFGMTVMFAAHKGRTGMGPLYTPFEEVLETSDVITLHCPLLPETRNLIGLDEFRRMARRPLLINTSRGGLVDERALATALREGLIAGAGFDVATEEPPAADNPLMSLLDLPNFILTPHVAWASQEARQLVADQLIDNIDAFIAGAPQNVVSGAF